jgi:hypothetical protein
MESKFKIDMEATFTINEREARAMDALVGYGGADFIKVFQQSLGKSYLAGYENDLIKLFEKWRSDIGTYLYQLDEARKVLSNKYDEKKS